MRSVVVGAALAVAVVAATITFGASLHRLVSRPALYGWNWDRELVTPGGGQYISIKKAAPLLRGDPDVEAWSGYYFDTLRIDGQTVPILGTESDAAVSPPLLSGHRVEARDQIVLGELTLAELGKHVGDTVNVSYGQSTSRRVRIVGTATMPAVGPPTELHLSVGTGAVADFRFIPADVLNGQGRPGLFSPNAIFVRFRPGVDGSVATARLRSIGRAAATKDSGGLQVVGVQRPAEIVNYRAMGSTPMLLAAGIALGATIGLGLALIASVRRRRPTLAVFKALGFTRRQVASSVSWQSNTVVVGGAIVGLPLGIMVGRIAWISFAHQLHVFPRVTVPAAGVGVLVVGALVLATALSIIPARIAARTPTAELLRVE
jgi:putative ABC transport system permease protein